MILSEKAYDAIDNIEYDAHNKIIEIIAEEVCQKRVSRPVNDLLVKFDENGPYYIDSVIEYDGDEGHLFVEIYNDDMTWHQTASLVIESIYDAYAKV